MWERDWRIVLAEMAQQIEDLQTRVETLTQEQALLRAALLELTGETRGGRTRTCFRRRRGLDRSDSSPVCRVKLS